jgi:lipopolysaccharide export system protein LptA
MDQSAQTLSARGSVVSRLPRSEDASVSEGDYVQVTAEALDYAGKESAAGYRGNVRLRQREGWLQAERLDAAPAGERRAEGGARLAGRLLRV